MRTPITGKDRASETGLIIFTNFLFHALEVGALDLSGRQGTIRIKNCTGPFNRLTYTRDGFAGWNPADWEGDMVID